MQRKIDQLRRVVIPSKFFKELAFCEKQEIEIFMKHDELFIRKFQRENWQTQSFVGIVRSIDSAHRIVIPSEYLRLLEIIPRDIVFLKLENGCIKIKTKEKP